MLEDLHIICITGKRGCGDALHQFTEQGIPFTFHQVSAVYDTPVQHGIKQAHSNALKLAKSIGLEKCVIVEDDVELTSKDSLRRFIEVVNSAIGVPVILGGCHNYEALFDDKKGRWSAVCGNLSGFHMYSVLSDSVDFDQCPPNAHIDNWAGRNFAVAVCNPMVAVQSPGWSEHRQREVDYSEMFGRYPILRD